MEYKVNKLEETETIAKDFILNLKPKIDRATVVGLYGDLGVGKTFFTQVVAKTLKVKDNVVSPTFVIEKIYLLQNQKFSHLIHIDAYRLEKSSELVDLGWKNIISDPKNLILIEWPDKVLEIMPEHIKIHIKHSKNQDSREIQIDLI